MSTEVGNRKAIRLRYEAAARIKHGTILVLRDEDRDDIVEQSKRLCCKCGAAVVAYLLKSGGEVCRCEKGHPCGGHWRVAGPEEG